MFRCRTVYVTSQHFACKTSERRNTFGFWHSRPIHSTLLPVRTQWMWLVWHFASLRTRGLYYRRQRRISLQSKLKIIESSFEFRVSSYWKLDSMIFSDMQMNSGCGRLWRWDANEQLIICKWSVNHSGKNFIEFSFELTRNSTRNSTRWSLKVIVLRVRWTGALSCWKIKNSPQISRMTGIAFESEAPHSSK